ASAAAGFLQEPVRSGKERKARPLPAGAPRASGALRLPHDRNKAGRRLRDDPHAGGSVHRPWNDQDAPRRWAEAADQDRRTNRLQAVTTPFLFLVPCSLFLAGYTPPRDYRTAGRLCPQLARRCD